MHVKKGHRSPYNTQIGREQTNPSSELVSIARTVGTAPAAIESNPEAAYR